MDRGEKMRFTAFFAIVLVLACAVSGATGYAQRRAYGDSEFRLGPDDKIEVFVYKETELSKEVVVRPDGKVSLPLIGELLTSGKTAVELQKEIAQKLTQYIADPVVSVIVKEVNSAQVSVLGEVKTPGMYKITNRATVLDAIALAGGFTEYAKRNKVTVIRTGPSGEQKRIKLDVDRQIRSSEDGDLFYVLPYDKIYIQ
jgi:polysaccharide export outer membrane protein